MTLTFTATVYLPGFQFLKQYHDNPHKFVQDWLEGAATNVCGQFPAIKGGNSGTILNRPKVKVDRIMRLHRNSIPAGHSPLRIGG